MIMFEILQDGTSMFINLDRVIAVTEDPEDEGKTQLWISMAEDSPQFFRADEPVWDLMARIKAEIGQ
jgi:hypothetical protein